MNKYKLLAIDLDGTLLKEDKTISRKDKESIRKCIENDIKVVISSGRALQNIKVFAEELGIKKGYCSAFHGSTIFRSVDFKIVNETFLNNDLAKEILEKVKLYNNIGIMAYTSKGLYTTESNKLVEEYNNEVKGIELIKINSFNQIKEPISKVLVKGDRELLEQVRLDFKEYDDKCKSIFSELDLLEFVSLETNKGYSLEFIAKMENIDIKDTIAIGDNYNDIEMLQKAGLGVAVANAVDNLKNIADYITCNTNEENAISEVIEKFFSF